MAKRVGGYTVEFEKPMKITGYAAVAGQKESEGRFGSGFDKVVYDAKAGQTTWEQAESAFQREALSLALEKSGCKAEELDFLFSGDLLNQCISSTYGLKDFSVPYLGQYGACSTMAQGLIMAAVMLEASAARVCAAVTSSNFCAAERQYRFPLEYGGQRTPTAQWTVSAAGACIVASEVKGKFPLITGATVGMITDLGITDANNMGAAMAPAAAKTLLSYFSDTGTIPSDYDAVYTGDLGVVGSELLRELMMREGVDISAVHRDCGEMIFDRERQDVHAGGSGCGCAASVLCGHILPSLCEGELHRVLFVATGAMMSPTSCQQGQSIPSVAHLVRIEM